MRGGDLQLPPGFRFHPTDDELVTHYLCRKCTGESISVPIIAEIDLYKYNPWELPRMALYGEKEWYFFSPRDRKYPNGSRPNRAAGSGYWKATGADKPIGKPKPIAIKKALVFYDGKAPRGEKTNWIMHEYRLAEVDRSVRGKNNLRLDDWVLCRIYNKKGSTDKKLVVPKEEQEMAAPPRQQPPSSEFLYFESDSVPKVHADSSSEQVQPSSTPELTYEREVQSQPRWNEWNRGSTLEIPGRAGSFSSLDSGLLGQLGQLSPLFQDPLQDIFKFLQKPF